MTLTFVSEEKRTFKHPLLSGSNSRGLHADLLEELKDFAQNGARKKNRQQHQQLPQQQQQQQKQHMQQQHKQQQQGQHEKQVSDHFLFLFRTILIDFSI